MRHLVRLRTAAIAAAVLGAATVLPTSTPAWAKPKTCHTKPGPGWEATALPEFAPSPYFTETGAEIVAVDPSDPRSIFVGGGAELFHSSDGGCKWNKVFPTTAETGVVDCSRLDDASSDVSPGCAHIYDLDIVPARKGPSQVFVQIYIVRAPLLPGVSLTFTSKDGGEVWERFISDVPDAGLGRGPLTVAPNDPKTIYVMRAVDAELLGLAGSAATSVLVTRDGGATWERSSFPGSADGLVMDPAGGLVVHPEDSEDVWAIAWHPTQSTPSSLSTQGLQLLHSPDAGTTWEVVNGPPANTYGATRPISLAIGSTPVGSTMVALGAGTQAWLSIDGGLSWGSILTFQNSSETVGKVIFGDRDRWVFVVGTRDAVVRYGIGRATTPLKELPFSPSAQSDGSGNFPISYVPGGGLYLLGDRCQQWCFSLYRYNGAGI